jgi:hypothetical protein
VPGAQALELARRGERQGGLLDDDEEHRATSRLGGRVAERPGDELGTDDIVSRLDELSAEQRARPPRACHQQYARCRADLA